MSEREIFTKLKNPQLQGGSMRFVDLFCGIGGFHHALSDLNHECVFACDIDKDCNEVYLRNWQMSSKGDIRNLSDTVPEHDILCAGFPQGFCVLCATGEWVQATSENCATRGCAASKAQLWVSQPTC